MGKGKSAVCLSLISLAIAVLLVVCFVSFPCGEIYYFHSLLAQTKTDSELGGYLIDDEKYVGGSYSVTYYPEGVISAQEYEETLAGKAENEKAEYEQKYSPNKAVYLEKEVVCKNDGSKVDEEFVSQFEGSVNLIKNRFEQLHIDGASVAVKDDYTICVTLPARSETAITAFRYLGYMGEMTVSFGASEDDATVIMPAQKGKQHSIDYYLKGAKVTKGQSQDGSQTIYGVAIPMTKEGSEAFKNATAEENTLFLKIGDETVISLAEVSSTVFSDEIHFYPNSATNESVSIIVSLFDNCIKNGSSENLKLTVGETTFQKAGAGESALTYLYLALGILIAISLVFFFIRYRGLGFAHMLTFFIFAIAMTLCVWSIPSLYLSTGTILAFALSAILTSVSDFVTFEKAKKEYAYGKTITYSVKTGYKKCTWQIFDVHAVLAILAFLTYAISLTGLGAFALTFGLGVLLSGICSLAVNRFMWHITMCFAKNKGKFCNFKREAEVEDDD